MNNDAVFGFVHATIIEGLKSFGNWKMRQGAIESLSETIDFSDFSLQPIEIPEFLDFLFSLMDDPNFKIKQGTIQIMRSFVTKLGKPIEYHLKDLVPKLVERLSDPKIYVREGCFRIFRSIESIIGPIKTILVLKSCFQTASSRKREDIVLVYIQTLLSSVENEEIDSMKPYLEAIVFEALVETVVDDEERISDVAIEGFRILYRQMSRNAFQALLEDGHKLSDDLIRKIINRCEEADPLPYLDSNGCVTFNKPKKRMDDDRASFKGENEICDRYQSVSDRKRDDCMKVSFRAKQENVKSTVHDIESRDESERPVRFDLSASSNGSTGYDIYSRRTGGGSSADHRFFRRLLQKTTLYTKPQIQSPDPFPENKNDSRETSEESVYSTVNVDRIAETIRRRDALPNTERFDSQSKSATLGSKKREFLDRLKMKQKDRRTRSANAILQRNLPEGESNPSIASETLPRIQTHYRKEEPSWTSPSKESLGFEAVHRSPAMEDRMAHDKRMRMFEDEINQDTPRFGFTPRSIPPTRPGTFASGISSSPKTATCDITTTEPFLDPEAVIQSVIDRLKAANNARKKEMDWLTQAEALNDARRLVYHHPTFVKKHQRDFVIAFVPAMQQLRSTNARSAIALCQDVFEALGDSIEHEIEDIVPILLKKAGETSNAGRDTFLAAEADRALSVMIRNVPLMRSFNALLQNANTSSKYVRSKVAAHLDDCLSHATTKLKATANLTLIDRLFKIGVMFLEEGSQQTRTHGKRILWQLRSWINNRGAFERLMGQIEPEIKKRRVREILNSNEALPSVPNRNAREQLSKKEYGNDLSPVTPSIHPPERSKIDEQSNIDSSPETIHTKYSKAFGNHSESKRSTENDVSDKRLLKQPHRHASRSSGAESIHLPETFYQAVMDLSSKDWRSRIDALQQIETMAEKLKSASDRDLLNVMDQLTYRLTDGNSKVVLVTFETLKAVFQRTGKNSVPALNSVIPAIAGNFASSSDKIRSAAEETLDRLIESVDGVYIVQNLSHCCAHGNSKTKAVLLQKLDRIAPGVYSRKPQFVTRYILPVAFSILNDVGLDVREANASLLRNLANLIGRSFAEKADTLTGNSRQRLFDILQGNY